MTISIENIQVLVIIRTSLASDSHNEEPFEQETIHVFNGFVLFSIHVGILLIPIVLLYVPDLEYKV